MGWWDRDTSAFFGVEMSRRRTMVVIFILGLVGFAIGANLNSL